MNIKTTRFILSLTGTIILGVLAFYGISQSDAVTPPLCVTAIGGIAGGYQWSKAHTNAKHAETNLQLSKNSSGG